MAHKGRSLLGGIFKGTRQFGPDFMEAGDRVLLMGIGSGLNASCTEIVW